MFKMFRLVGFTQAPVLSRKKNNYCFHKVTFTKMSCYVCSERASVVLKERP